MRGLVGRRHQGLDVLWRGELDHLLSLVLSNLLVLLQLLSLTSAPLPDVATVGVEREECPEYQADRRPELVEATAYFSSTGSSSGSNDGWAETWDGGLVALLSFLAGGMATVVGLLVWSLAGRRRADQDPLVMMTSSSSSQQAPPKAKNSF